MALTIENLEIQIEANATRTASGIDALTRALEDLRIAVSALTPQLSQASMTLRNMGNRNVPQASRSFNNLGKSFTKGLAKITAFTLGMDRLTDIFADAFNESNEYIESLNLFRVTMGEGADSAMEFANKIEDLMGIDISEWITNQGVFMRMATGFGVSADKAELMSQNLTQLGYDLSSFFNTDIDTAMQKLQSGMTGQIKGLKAFGYNLSVAALQETAFAHGIEQSVRTMTEAQKAQLRYITLIENSNGIMGDMARTLITPANAMRILSAQLVQLKRALGNIVSVIATQVIPWVRAFVEIMTEAATALAHLLGFQLPEIDYSGMDNIGSDIEDGLDAAIGSAKELKRQLLGIDELTILDSPNSGSGGSALGGDLGIELPEYNFLDGLTERTDEIKKRLKTILTLAGLIGAAFLAWKFGGAFLSGLKDVATALGYLLGITPTVLTQSQSMIASFLKFGAVAAVIGTIALRFLDLYTNSEQFRVGVKRVGEALSGVFGFVKAILVDVWGVLKDIGLAVLDMLPDSVKNYILGALKEIQGWITTLDLDWKDLLITIAGLGLMFVPGGQILGIVLLAFEGITVALRTLGLVSDETWMKIKSAATTVATAVKDFFIACLQGVINYFVGTWTMDWRQAWDGLSIIAGAALDLIGTLTETLFGVNIVNVVKNWFENHVKPWFTVEKWSELGNSVKQAIKNGVNGAIGVLNQFIDWCNRKLSITIPSISILGETITKAKTFRLFTIPKIPTFAGGGFPSQGEMFIAREAGPELVGRIGSKSAVANNSQIVDGISAGVRNANEDVVNAVFAVAQQIIGAIRENGGDIYLDGSKVGQKTTEIQNRRNRMYGKALNNA